MLILGEGGREEGKTCLLPAPGAEGNVSRGGAGTGLLLCQEILSLVGGRDITAQGQCLGALLELFVLLLHPSDLCGSVWECVCVCCFVFPPCFLVIIPSKVTEISFVRQADRALSYYGIT